MTDYLSAILNFIIPPAIFIALGWWLVKLFSPITKGLGGAISGQYDKLRGETERSKEKNITYE